MAERFLAHSGSDRAPWLAVAFGGGISAWLVLSGPWQWLGFMAACLGIATAALAVMDAQGRYPFIRQCAVIAGLALAAGCAVIWARSGMVGAQPIDRPIVAQVNARVADRIDQPAQARTRLVLALRLQGEARALRVRVNVPDRFDDAGAAEGALIALRVRLMPPAPPMLPGGYDFARAAWFQGISATGSALGPVTVLEPADGSGGLSRLKRRIASHILQQIDGSSGGIAAALVTGDRGAIAAADEEAMRESGLSHLLSVSGLHVSAVVAAVYALSIRLLALWPWLALRVRLPLVAAACAAGAGIGYTLLTGAEVPTLRSCIGAVLVLLALAMGRDPLSLRMLATGALVVMVFWPETLAGPSFQMSFGAVLAIIALHSAAPVRQFLAPRAEAWWQRAARRLAILLLTGVVIEIALMPIGLYHFHKTGFYGALANVVAIPWTTFVIMPLVALALFLDAVGLGAPVWWFASGALDLLLALARHVATTPGAVARFPAMPSAAFALFIAGGLWLGLMRGRLRLIGLAPAAIGLGLVAFAQAPDVLVSADGRHVGITGEIVDGLLVLREGRSDYALDNLTELSGMSGKVTPLAQWSGAQCTRDFCAFALDRSGRTWRVLVSRTRDRVPERELAAACDRADIVIADRWLPNSCRPTFLKADRSLLSRTGGIALTLSNGSVRTVAEGQGQHGWWTGSTAPRTRKDGIARKPAPGLKPGATSHQ